MIPNDYGTAELRKAYRRHYEECDRIYRQQTSSSISFQRTTLPAFPAECLGMLCGAKTRRGTRCRNTSLYINGRCKFHGGLTTGPTTAEGKEQSRINGRKNLPRTQGFRKL